MAKPLSTTEHARRGSGFRPVGNFVSKSSKKIGSKRGFHDQFLIAHWQDVVGDELGKITRPYAYRPSKSKGANLVLECASGYVAEVQMRSEEIRHKINTTLGHEAIVKITLRHHVMGFAETKPAYKPQPKAVRDVPKDLQDISNRAASTELKNALNLIANSYYNKGK